ncbi:HAD hydrolase family protein [Enemella sp. A6]|uniref:HAD hydrolase family protein n=1 Tax=Enemella sp. A6 TaxID=3440152 RepID=UPI003EBA9167
MSGSAPVRMIASDLDGTFLDPTGAVSPLNREAVRAAAEAGLHVVFATGRPPSWLSVLEELDLAHTVVVASNGALLYDIATRQVLQQHAMSNEVVLDLAERLRAALPGVVFGIQQNDRFGHEPGYFEGVSLTSVPDSVDRATVSRFLSGLVEGELSELVTAGEFVKVLVKHPTATAAEMAEVVEQVAGGEVTATYSMGGATGLLELSAPGISKATTLATYAESLGIDSAEVAAFGDMPNDLAMLHWAGRPHLMADHDPTMTELGFPVIGSNADDAVGRTILSWLP